MRSLVWTATSAIGQQIVQFGFTAAFAHILLPNDFGLIAILAFFVGLSTLLVDMGLSAAIVQRREIEPRHLDTAFWANAALGFAAMLAMMALAPGLAFFYGHRRLLGLALAEAPVLFISSLSGVQTALLERELNFRRLLMLENVAFLGGNLLGLGLALVGAGVWAFVALALAAAFLRTLLLWSFGNWRPAGRLDWGSLKDLWAYSKSLTGFLFINYFSRNVDNLLIGRFLGAAPLAFYDRAYNLMLTPVDLVGSIASRVMFPALSRLQGDAEQARRVYLVSLRSIALFSCPAAAGLFVVSRPFVLTILGTRWTPTIELIRLLCVCSFLQSLFQATGWIFRSQGRTDLLFRIGWAWSIGVIIAFAIGVRFGVRGVAIAYTGTNVLGLVPSFGLSGRIIGVSSLEVVRSLMGPVVAATVMGAAVWLLDMLLFARSSAPIQLLVSVPAGVLVYAALVYLVDLQAYREVRSIIKGEFGR